MWVTVADWLSFPRACVAAGSGPTSYLASRYPVKGVVLVSPLLSAMQVVLPCWLLACCCCCLCDVFPNYRRIRRFKAPVLVRATYPTLLVVCVTSWFVCEVSVCVFVVVRVHAVVRVHVVARVHVVLHARVRVRVHVRVRVCLHVDSRG